MKEKYAKGLFASGKSGRWNMEDEYVIYTSGSRSLATLELLVNQGHSEMDFRVLVIYLPDDRVAYQEIKTSDLPHKWRSVSAYHNSQRIGSKWYLEKSHLVLEVPSAVVQKKKNYIINASHKDFLGSVKLIESEPYFWDRRLLRH